MKYRFFRVSAVLFGVLLTGTSYAAGQSRASKIYTHCTDDSAQLSSQCMMYPSDSASYTMCMGNATSNAVYSCQRYRVPSNYEGTFFDNLDLDRYPKVGAPTPPRPGTAPLDLKGSLLGTVLHLY